MNAPTLSIIIITLNEEERLPLLLGDIAEQTWDDFEIVHVDSDSDDRTIEISEAARPRFADYRIVAMKVRGVGLGRNVGAHHARGERLLFLDADTRISPDFLRSAMGELEQRNIEAGVVCMSGEGLGPHYRAGFAMFNAGIHLTARFFPTAIGACLFSTAALHKDIGGFDESLGLCEDCNYVLKAHRSNKQSVGILKSRFRFDPRRLRQDGFLATVLKYIHANLHRFFFGELHNQEITYQFGHYGRN